MGSSSTWGLAIAAAVLAGAIGYVREVYGNGFRRIQERIFRYKGAWIISGLVFLVAISPPFLPFSFLIGWPAFGFGNWFGRTVSNHRAARAKAQLE
ncbi:MAG: hypothetical protein ABL967_13160 [Bryobacteraceae bacterium]